MDSSVVSGVWAGILLVFFFHNLWFGYVISKIEESFFGTFFDTKVILKSGQRSPYNLEDVPEISYELQAQKCTNVPVEKRFVGTNREIVFLQRTIVPVLVAMNRFVILFWIIGLLLYLDFIKDFLANHLADSADSNFSLYSSGFIGGAVFIHLTYILVFHRTRISEYILLGNSTKFKSKIDLIVRLR